MYSCINPRIGGRFRIKLLILILFRAGDRVRERSRNDGLGRVSPIGGTGGGADA